MFKKLLYLFIGLVLLSSISFGQITNYKFSANTGGAAAFVPITGGTVLATAYNGTPDSDDGYVNGAPIGFTFNFNGINYTTYNVCTNGFITFGAALGATANWVNNLTSSAAVSRPIIAPYWDDLLINGSVSYVLTGAAPLRVLTIQWLNAGQYTGGTTISFQLKLYETTNIIESVYRQEAGLPEAGVGASIGIAAVATGTGNFLSLTTSTNAAVASSTVETTSLLRPATGQVFRFDPRYCAARGLFLTGGEKISRVVFNTIDNSSTSVTEYENFTTISTGVTPGNSYNLSTYLVNSYSGDKVYVWIDYNNNGLFTDAGESVYTSPTGAGPFLNVPITIPLTATLGITRMRIRLDDTGGAPANSTPCGDAQWGQVEDYSLNVQNCTASAESVPPANTTICNGGNGSFTVVAAGSGTTYQWQVSTDNGATFANVPNAAPYSNINTATLNITGATLTMNGYKYRAALGGTCTPAGVYSSVATLSVNTPATVTNPSNASTCTGNNATFSVTATGTSPAYQWQVSTDNGTTWTNVANGANYAGATTNSLTVIAAPATWNGYRYRNAVTVTSCGTVNSNGAILTVWALPTLTLSAAPYTKLFPGLITTLTANASPAAASNVFTWYKNGSVVTGSTGSSISVNVDGMGTYTASVKDANGCSSALSNSVTISDSVNGKVFIYPSPNKGQFQVRYYSVPGNLLPRTLTVFDAKGAKIQSQTYTVGRPYDRMDVNLVNAAPGIYWVELGDVNGKRLVVSRVVVLR